MTVIINLINLLSSQAAVVCRQLGYQAVYKVKKSQFRGTVDHFSYYDVNCYGLEYSIDSCSQQSYGECPNFEMAGVACWPGIPPKGFTLLMGSKRV